MESLSLFDPLDMHVHLREGEMLQNVAPYTAGSFAQALVMPNLKEPLRAVEQVLAYKKAIKKACANEHFEPLMTLFFHENLDRAELQKVKNAGIRVIKLYPKGSTTGSEAGVAQILTPKTLAILEAMQELGLILSVHGESSGFVLEREFEFLSVFEEIARTFPRLKIIIEHMSDARSLELLERFTNLYGTITLHHILYTLDDVIGGALRAHLFCKPTPKLPKDRDALLSSALNAHSKISFGSDSAPHLKGAKESAAGAAGIFSAPVLLAYLAEIFERHNRLENLQAFISDNAHKIYALPKMGKKVTLLKREWRVKEEYAGIVPLGAQRLMSWEVQ